jgi:hypothetical protein
VQPRIFLRIQEENHDEAQMAPARGNNALMRKVMCCDE